MAYKIKQFGVLTYSLDASQQAVLITHSLTALVAKKQCFSPIVFFNEYYQSIITPIFPMLQDVEMWSFQHPVIATNLETAKYLIHSPGPTKKLFYLMDLEWIYLKQKDYRILSDIYNSSIQLIARSQEHYDLIKSCWKKPIAIIKDFNYNDIIKII